MKTLTLKDFKPKVVADTLTYFSYEFSAFEICLEPCLNGFDIALYRNQNLVFDKICTDLDLSTTPWPQVYEKAVQLANDLYQRIMTSNV